MEGYIIKCQRSCNTRSRRLVIVMASMAAVLFVLQTLRLPSFSPHFPSSKSYITDGERSQNEDFLSQSPGVGQLSIESVSNNLVKSVKFSKDSDHGFGIIEMEGELEEDEDSNAAIDLNEGKDTDIEFPVDLENDSILEEIKDSENGFLLKADRNDKEHSPSVVEQTVILGNGTLRVDSSHDSATEKVISDKFDSNASISTTLTTKKKLIVATLSLSEMNELLLKNRASRRSMRPRWSSAIDKQILVAKKEIEKAPIVENDQQLFASLFRDMSKFKRSYELMEKTLKIYIYQEGKKPIFHQPLLGSIYSSEGWFMKLMESNRQFLVRDPRQAHLFYMPFSSRFLQASLYVPNSHNRTKLRQHLKNYVDVISTKYPFWNRTGGADHFLAACHDWALYETKNTMDHSIRALCVSDVGIGFQLGRDVGLPQTYVRSPKNPLKDLGGKPWNQRPILAFYAGSLHGNLRSILLHHWEDKDPDMKIFGPSTFRAVASKMNYAQHMKSSKYCICPRGYEANSPRLVESIFFECVPVIIADNYAPPFFEMLNWEKFSVMVPEKEVPRLKEILASIAELEYMELQMGVRKVQKHFLWHHKPVKYDLFHMILHSVWYSRVYNFKPR
ncbi:putative glycosyltransferase [Platanthera zijinensis]|uniref:Glycosyltransferase n=1 Tax=Platanthera zijinensis TaxID=2320716 RepID=A0AAP0AT51_9ASPA